MTSGDRIRLKREQLGMTQDELAKKLGYKSRSSVNKVEISRDISLKKIKEYAEALNCSPEYLLGWDEPKESTSEVITMEEKQFLNEFRKLDEESKRQLVLMLAFFKDQQNKK